MYRRRRPPLLYPPIPHILRRLLARRLNLHNHVRRVRRRRRLRLSPRLQTAHEPHVPAHLRQHLAIELIPAPLRRCAGPFRC
jgi:hypothetical protein